MSDLLALEQLTIGYTSPKGARKGACPIVRDMNANLRAGELVCLLGPNGAGKSTLLRTLAGVQAPLSGHVKLGSDDLHKLPQRALAKRMAVVLTERVTTDAMTARELVALGRHPHTDWSGSLRPLDHEQIQWAMHATNTLLYVERNVNELSDGERQRVLIARALAQEPQVMLLDEPTAFLDLPRRVEVLQLLRGLAHESQRAFLLSTHDLDLALHIADRVWLIASDGVFVTGLPEALALSGAITRTFQNEGVAFDVNSGTFRLCLPQGQTAQVVGDGPAAFWTKRMLERAGFNINPTNNAASAVQVEVVQPGTWRVQVGEAVSEATSLENVLALASRFLV